MASATFPFFRATFYRWAQRWPELCPGLTGAPEVLGVADLHVENYGTWRDVEGRLVWGINDFAKPLTSPTPLTWFAWRPAPHWQTVNEAFRYP
jgi:uncharacterized protein (DUF2252 family)